MSNENEQKNTGKNYDHNSFKTSNRFFRTIWLIVIVIIGFVIFSITYNYHVSKNKLRVGELKLSISNKFLAMKYVNTTIFDLRNLEQNVAIECKYERPKNLMTWEQERAHKIEEIAKAVTGIRFIFNDEVESTFTTITGYAEQHNIHQICTDNYSHYQEYDQNVRKFLFTANQLMGNSILKDKTALEKIGDTQGVPYTINITVP